MSNKGVNIRWYKATKEGCPDVYGTAKEIAEQIGTTEGKVFAAYHQRRYTQGYAIDLWKTYVYDCYYLGKPCLIGYRDLKEFSEKLGYEVSTIKTALWCNEGKLQGGDYVVTKRLVTVTE